MEVSEKIFRIILDSLSVHIYWTDRDTRIAGANLLQARNFGDKDVESCIGKNIW